MISEVVMPQMGADMTEGTIVRWLKHEGDAVDRGEVIAEIETDKANVEIEAFDGGIFRKILASEGDVIPVGRIIAVIAAPGDDISRYANGASASESATRAPALPPRSADKASGVPQTPRAEAPPTPPPPPDVKPPQPATAVQTVAAAPAANRVHVSPVARSLAEEHSLDLRSIRGSGPGGRIIRRDVEAAMASGPKPAQSTPPTPAPARPADEAGSGLARPSKMRQAIARRMSQSKREAPHYYLLLDIDMTDALEFRKQVNDALPEDQRVSINDLIVRASALALQRHPQFNATIAGEDVTPRSSQNVCIAIALGRTPIGPSQGGAGLGHDDGLIAPAILDAGNKSLARIAADAGDLVSRAQGGALRPEELNDGTFTITNLGAFGVEALIAIIQPPQTAILGVGSVIAQPAVRDGAVVVRQMMKVALSADHRVTDGAQGAAFIAEIKRLLEKPLLLVM